MSLTSHSYEYFSNLEKFLKRWEDLLNNLKGDTIKDIFGVWDNLENSWFDDAPMLVMLSSGIMSIQVKSERYLSIGWNDILPIKKPLWFDIPPVELSWKEDLFWKTYDNSKNAIGKKIKFIEVIKNLDGLIGLNFNLFDNLNLKILDVGDVIYSYVEGSNI